MDPPGPSAVRYFYSKSVAQNLSFLYRVIRLPDERTYGIVVGKFVWRSTTAFQSTSPASSLRLLALIRQRTNQLILSSEVTDLHFDNGDLAKSREEVYIQGISLVGIVATLIANVTYVASATPPRGLDPSRNGIAFASYLAVPKIFLLFNAVAFYASVLSVVLMTALIPIYGTAGDWGAIFLSSSVPAILSLVSCYVAFMINTWAVMDSWVVPLGTTVMGVIMVVYIHFWAVELMRGHVERSLHIHPATSPWKWYLERGRDMLPGRLARFRNNCKTLREMVERFTWHHQLLGLGRLHSSTRETPRCKLQLLFGKNAAPSLTRPS